MRPCVKALLQTPDGANVLMYLVSVGFYEVSLNRRICLLTNTKPAITESSVEKACLQCCGHLSRQSLLLERTSFGSATDSVDSFKTGLKTYLFCRAYSATS